MKQTEIVSNYKVFMPKESIDLVTTTLKSGWIGGDGPRVKEFEQLIAKLIKNDNVVALNSGTSALQLALRIADVRGFEVITTPMTCFATNAAIINEGGIPVWADIDSETGNIDPKDILKKITKKTRAIMVVHWGGSPAQLDAINKIASSFKIPVIEDGAQALGSEYKGKMVGNTSDFIVFSLQAIKIINTGDGGILVTKRKKDTKRAKILRWYGIDREARIEKQTFWDYPISEVGYKMQMTDISASIGLGQLPYLRKHLAYRRKIAKIYEDSLLKSKTIKAQKILSEAKSNYWIFTVLCENQKIRTKLFEALKKINVKGEEAHRRNDLYPVFKKYSNGKLPGVTKFNDTHLIIPVGHWVNEEKAQEIAKILENF